MHDLTEDLPGDDVAAMCGGAELVVVLLHLILGHVGPGHHQLHVLLTQLGHDGNGCGPAPHSFKVH